jgi:hypothetical protein
MVGDKMDQCLKNGCGKEFKECHCSLTQNQMLFEEKRILDGLKL